jgi:YbgC/YbaW family acyl-CoA thioester hydrolase
MFTYKIQIKESHLDTLGHVNNAAYLVLYEEARWAYLNSKNYPLEKVLSEKKGPVILEMHLKFLKELKLRDEVTITFEPVEIQKKTVKILQKMLMTNQDVAAELLITVAFFDLQTRKIIEPNRAWNHVLGIE